MLLFLLNLIFISFSFSSLQIVFKHTHTQTQTHILIISFTIFNISQTKKSSVEEEKLKVSATFDGRVAKKAKQWRKVERKGKPKTKVNYANIQIKVSKMNNYYQSSALVAFT